MTDQTVPAAATETPPNDTPVSAEETAKQETPAGETTETKENPSEEDGDPDADPSPKRQRPGKWARQVQRLEAQNQALQQTVTTILGQLNGGAKAKTETDPVVSAGEPRQEDFKTYEDFVAAKAEYKVRQEFAARDAAQRAEQETKTKAETERAYAARCAAASKVYEDFEEVAFDPSVPITHAMADVIKSSEKGPDLQYYLGTHLDEADAIARMGSPLQQALALGRIEAKLALPKPKKVTAAPAPPTTLTGADRPQKPPSEMSMDEYVAWRKSQGGLG